MRLITESSSTLFLTSSPSGKEDFRSSEQLVLLFLDSFFISKKIQLSLCLFLTESLSMHRSCKLLAELDVSCPVAAMGNQPTIHGQSPIMTFKVKRPFIWRSIQHKSTVHYYYLLSFFSYIFTYKEKALSLESSS